MPQQPPRAKPVEVSDLEIETMLIRDAVGPENFEKAIAAGTLGTISQEAKNNKRHQLQIEEQKRSDEAWWASSEGKRARAEQIAAEAEAFGQPEPENDLGGFQPEATSPAEAELLRMWSHWTNSQRAAFVQESGLDEAAVTRVAEARQRHSFS